MNKGIAMEKGWSFQHTVLVPVLAVNILKLQGYNDMQICQAFHIKKYIYSAGTTGESQSKKQI